MTEEKTRVATRARGYGMRYLLTIGLVAALVMTAGTASGVVFLYEDFEGEITDWWKTTDSLWHIETYRSHSGSHSAAYNLGGDPNYTYNTGGTNWGYLFSPVVDITGASALYMDVWSWLETENAPGDTAYYWDVAKVAVYDPSFAYEFGFDDMDVNFYPHSQWVHLESPDDAKPMFDFYGVTQFRLGFYFDTVDAIGNDYEGWYLDDLRIHDGEAPPIPEPSTWLLLSTGLLGVGAAARKRFFG